MFEDGLDCSKDWKRNLLLGIAILDFSNCLTHDFGWKINRFFWSSFFSLDSLDY